MAGGIFVLVNFFLYSSQTCFMNTPLTQIQTVIVENHTLFIQGLLAMFEDTNVNVVSTAGSWKQLSAIVRTPQKIDLILLDLNLETDDGFEIIDRLNEGGFQQKIIILTMYDSLNIIRKVRAKDVAGFVLKNTTKSNLLAAIETVCNGGTHYDKVIEDTHYLEPKITYSDDFIKKHKLSEREYEVMILLAKSYSTKEIAHTLFISEQTVSTYRKHIKAKLKLKSIADIVRYAFVNQLI